MKCTKEHRLSYNARAEEIVKGLTLEEKVFLMSGRISLEEMVKGMKEDPNKHYNYIPYPAGGIDEKGIPAMKFCDGPRGVVCGVGQSTCFPVTMARGATFDVELEERVGRAIGKEIRAWGGNLFGGVCINLPYNPGWGRSQETYGEESFHLGQMGSALVRGVQAENVIACVKHYAFNSMEISRFKVDVDADKRTEREVYLPHFKDCIDAGAASVMSAYNLYKGVHCGHSDYLLNQVLKGEWDFDGFVISDFIWGILDTADAANGGMDIEMCATIHFGDKLVKAVRDGLVPEEKIDEAAVRIIRTLLAFTEADDKEYDMSLVGCDEHIALARECAEKGITLLQNTDNVLPLNKNKLNQILVLGELADKGVIGDYGSSRVFPKYIVTPLQGITDAVPNNVEVVYYSGEDLEHARKLAGQADAVVFVVGYDHDDEGEYVSEDQTDAYTGGIGGDRVNSLGLHQHEIDLIKAVGPVNKNSVAVLIGGNMIMMTEWKDDVSGILMAYYPGMEGGTALANIIFGDVNPSGKLPYVVPYKEEDLPQVEWDTTEQFYEYYHGYAKLEREGVEPLLPYGFGLSYTTFEVKDAKFNTDGQSVTAQCTVTNTGGRAGAEVVQMYVGFSNSKVHRPVKILRGFARVELEAGESKDVTISCPVEKLRWYNEETNAWELEKMEYEVYIGTSSADRDLLQGKVTIS
ncbi:MAG TPA: glycosyl hydrolase [Firmicutes bacterium]|jgi:beta-glucosidase|nr:glycosyl hydrolase [Bacillota bacterium]